MKQTLAIRIDAENPLHHLWNNRGTWWIHYTVHTGDGRKRRVRYSLGTGCPERARVLRDAVFASLAPPEPAPPEGGSRPAFARGLHPKADAAPRRPLHPAVELAASFDGFELGVEPPDIRRMPFLARIDRGRSTTGPLVDTYHLVGGGHGGVHRLWLWATIDASQMADGAGRFVPVARTPILAWPRREAPGGIDVRAAAAHLLHGWIASIHDSCAGYDEPRDVGGSPLLDAGSVERILRSACRGLPLELPEESE